MSANRDSGFIHDVRVFHDWECPVCECAQADPPDIDFTVCSNGHAVELRWKRGELIDVIAQDDPS
jgi:hypothetical protein